MTPAVAPRGRPPGLPELLVLTDRTQASGPLPAVVRTLVDGGARAIVLREKDLPDDARARLAAELRAVLDPVGGLLVVAGTAPAGRAEGIHLAAHDRFPVKRPALVGRSCHSSAEIAQARREGADYVFVSPVFPTSSKPGYGPALGLDGLAALIPTAPPVFALGGIGPDDVAGCLAAGACGVAVMGPLMRDPELVRRYLAQ